MSNNKNKVKQNEKKGKKQKQNHITSIAKVEQFIGKLLFIVDEEIDKVERQKYLYRTIGKVSYSRSLINVEEFFHKGLTFQPNKASFTDDQQPTSISLDNLSRTKISKTDVKTVKQLNIISRVTTLTRSESKTEILKIKKKQRSVKLQLETIEQKKVFSDLRQRKLNLENEKIKKDQEEQEEKKRMERKNKLSFNAGFDYNGQLLPRIDINRSNLVEKVLQLKLKNQKTAKRNIEPQQASVGEIKKKGYKKKEKSEKEKSEFMEFLDSQSLTDSVEITRGIRYSTNSLIFQEKKKTISIPDLKSRLGKRRMSKPEFAKIRTHVENQQMLKYKKMKTEFEAEKKFSLKRAFSEANNNSRFKQREYISIVNPQLRESMLIRLEDYEPYLVIEKEFPPEEEVNCLVKDAEPSSLIQEKSEKSFFLMESNPATPKLPSLSRNKILQIDPQSMILTRLQEELRNKQRI